MSITTSEARAKFNDLKEAPDEEIWDAVNAIRDDLEGRPKSWVRVDVEREVQEQ